MFEHRLHLSKIGHTFLNGVSLSDLIWTYVVAGAYCLVQGRVWRFYRRNKDRLDPLSTSNKMFGVDGKRTVTREVVCYSFRGVMEICRLSTHPGGFAAFETDMELVHSFVYICLRSHIRKTGLTHWARSSIWPMRSAITRRTVLIPFQWYSNRVRLIVKER